MHPVRTFPAFTTAFGPAEHRMIFAFGGMGGELFKAAFDAKAAADKDKAAKEAVAKKEGMEADEKGGEGPVKRAAELVKGADARLRGVRGDMEAIVKRSSMFGELSRSIRVTPDMQKSAADALRQYDPQRNYSKEDTISQLQLMGFSAPNDAQLDQAKQNAVEGRPVSPPLTPGTAMSVLGGGISMLMSFFARFKDPQGMSSERGQFLSSLESYNAQNRHTASLALRNNATSGREDLMVTLRDPSTSEPKARKEQMEKRLTEIEQQFKIGLMNAERPVGTPNTFVIPNATENKVRQVRNMLATIRDPEDSRPPPAPSTGGPGGPTGGPSSGPTEGPKARQEAEKTARALISQVDKKLRSLGTSPAAEALRKNYIDITAPFDTDFSVADDATATKQIREHMEPLRKLGDQVDKMRETETKDLDAARKGANDLLAEVEKGAKADVGLIPESMRKRVETEAKELHNQVTNAREAAPIQKAMKTLTDTLGVVNAFRPVYEAAQKAIDATNKQIGDASVRKDLVDALQQNIKLLETALAAPIPPATPESITKATQTLVKTAEELERRETEGKLRKRAAEARGRVQSLREPLEKASGGLPDGGGWNGKEAMEKSARVEEIIKNVRLDPALTKELEALTTYLEGAAKVLEGIVKGRADTARIETAAKTRLNEGKVKILNKDNYGGSLTGMIRTRPNNTFDIDIHGGAWGGSNTVDVLVIKWDAPNKCWQWGLTAYYDQTPPTWFRMNRFPTNSFGDSLSRGNIHNNTGYGQAIAIVGHLNALEETHPV